MSRNTISVFLVITYLRNTACWIPPINPESVKSWWTSALETAWDFIHQNVNEIRVFLANFLSSAAKELKNKTEVTTDGRKATKSVVDSAQTSQATRASKESAEEVTSEFVPRVWEEPWSAIDWNNDQMD